MKWKSEKIDQLNEDALLYFDLLAVLVTVWTMQVEIRTELLRCWSNLFSSRKSSLEIGTAGWLHEAMLTSKHSGGWRMLC